MLTTKVEVDLALEEVLNKEDLILDMEIKEEQIPALVTKEDSTQALEIKVEEEDYIFWDQQLLIWKKLRKQKPRKKIRVIDK